MTAIPVIVVDLGDDAVVVTVSGVVTVNVASVVPDVVIEAGSKGPKGDTGPQGASAAGSHIHHQGFPATVWEIDHQLGFYPNITTMDSLGRVVEGDIVHVDMNHAQAIFDAAFSGSATCS